MVEDPRPGGAVAFREHRPRTPCAACHDPGRERGEDRGGPGDGRGHVQGQPHGLGRSRALERVTSAFFQGQAIGAFSNGVSRSLSPEVAELLKRVTGVELGGPAGAKSAAEHDGSPRAEA